MSTKLGTLHNTGSRGEQMTVTRYWGNNATPCIQLTAKMEDGEWGYVQLTEEDLATVGVLFNYYLALGKFTPGDDE